MKAIFYAGAFATKCLFAAHNIQISFGLPLPWNIPLFITCSMLLSDGLKAAIEFKCSTWMMACCQHHAGLID
jgi:hypothetical protein